MENFNSAYMLSNLLYNLEITPEEFEEIGLVAWNRIGNKHTKLYRYSVDVDCADKEVALPCNCDEIEAVTYPFEDWNYVTNTTPNGDYASQFTEEYIEGRKVASDPLYTHGKFVKYERVGDNIYFDLPYGRVDILYKGVELDDNGLPYLNEKEKDAIAVFCAYITKFKEGLSTHNLAVLTESLMLQLMWMKYCDAARVTPYVNLNDMDKILDAKTTWNRKIFNKSYKPVK